MFLCGLFACSGVLLLARVLGIFTRYVIVVTLGKVAHGIFAYMYMYMYMCCVCVCIYMYMYLHVFLRSDQMVCIYVHVYYRIGFIK